jgi:UrcA family protein
MSSKITPIALAALVALGFAAAAHAAPDADTVSVKVRTAGLNLASDPGARIALNRVHQAADKICGGRPDSRALGELATYRACLKTTVDSAVASTNAPTLQALNGSQQPAAIRVAATR